MMLALGLLVVIAAQSPAPAEPEPAVPDVAGGIVAEPGVAPAGQVYEAAPPPADATGQVPELAPVPPVTAAPVVAPAPEPVQWDDMTRELAMTAEGGIDVCEALSLPLSLIPGIGSAVGTITEWVCLVPAAIAVDTVAIHFGGRDASLWQATVALLAKKLFQDLLSTPLTVLVAIAAIGGVAAIVGSTLLSIYVVAGFPVFLPTLITVGAGTLLVAPVALLRDKGGEAIFSGLFSLMTNQVYGDELAKKRKEAFFQPGDVGWARPYVLLSAAAGTKGETGLADLVPIVGPFWKAGEEATALKERMRRVGRDVLRDAPGRDLSGMDATIDVVTTIKGAAASTGQGVAIAGLAVGLTGAILQGTEQVDQPTGETIGFVGLGIALTGLGIYALSSTLDTVKTLAVPCAYGINE